MPCTPWRSTSSATRNASTIEVVLSSTVSRRALGMTISVSTSFASSSTPMSACSPRRAPSKANGLVTMPTVSAPTSRAMRATTGAAPVPVPPPAPAVMNTMSAPLSAPLRRVVLLHRGRAAELGVGARAEPAGALAADVQAVVGGGLLERLHVGVDGDELDALDLRLDHAVDGVDAGAADAHHAQDGLGWSRATAAGEARVATRARARGRAPSCSRGCPRRTRCAGAPRAWARPRSG